MNTDIPSIFNCMLGLKFKLYNKILYNLGLTKQRIIKNKVNFTIT